MMKSMTGYGKVQFSYLGKNYECEIKTLNSKQADISTKSPQLFKSKDLDIRSLITKELERGKIDFSLSYSLEDNTDNIRINETVLEAYYDKLEEFCQKKGLNIKNDNTILSTLLRFSDVQKVEQEQLDENLWLEVEKNLKLTLEQVNNFRIQEGEILKQDFIKRINLILDYLKEVEPFENQRVSTIKEKIFQRFEELKSTVELDKNRLEQELIYYFEKLDITEEKVRLKHHCDYFLETMDSENPGKKLGFIAQEIGREINTLGSKANHAQIQKIVVMMKDELEKIKEQVLNVL